MLGGIFLAQATIKNARNASQRSLNAGTRLPRHFLMFVQLKTKRLWLDGRGSRDGGAHLCTSFCATFGPSTPETGGVSGEGLGVPLTFYVFPALAAPELHHPDRVGWFRTASGITAPIGRRDHAYREGSSGCVASGTSAKVIAKQDVYQYNGPASAGHRLINAPYTGFDNSPSTLQQHVYVTC